MSEFNDFLDKLIEDSATPRERLVPDGSALLKMTAQPVGLECWNQEFAKTGEVRALKMLDSAETLNQEGTTGDPIAPAGWDTGIRERLEAPQQITHEGVTFDLSKAQPAPTGGIAELFSDATLKEVVPATKKKSGKFGEGTLSFLNRHARRRLEAFEKSNKWQQMLRAGERAAVTKLNKESAKIQKAWDKFGSPED